MTVRLTRLYCKRICFCLYYLFSGRIEQRLFLLIALKTRSLNMCCVGICNLGHKEVIKDRDRFVCFFGPTSHPFKVEKCSRPTPGRWIKDFLHCSKRDKKRFSIILFFKPFKLRHGDISMNLNYLTDLPDSSCSCSGFVFFGGVGWFGHHWQGCWIWFLWKWEKKKKINRLKLNF